MLLWGKKMFLITTTTITTTNNYINVYISAKPTHVNVSDRLLLSFLWVSSTFTSAAATLAWFSSVSLPLHAACHPDTTECLWHCHLRCHVLTSSLSLSSAACRTGPSGKHQILLFPNAVQWQQDSIFFMHLGSYNFIDSNQENRHCSSQHHWWSWLYFRMEWENFSWIRMGFAWRESLSSSCLSTWMRSSPEG